MDHHAGEQRYGAYRRPYVMLYPPGQAGTAGRWRPPTFLHLSVNFLRWKELRQQKYHRGQQALGGIVEERILSIIGIITAGIDNRSG